MKLTRKIACKKLSEVQSNELLRCMFVEVVNCTKTFEIVILLHSFDKDLTDHDRMPVSGSGLSSKYEWCIVYRQEAATPAFLSASKVLRFR